MCIYIYIYIYILPSPKTSISQSLISCRLYIVRYFPARDKLLLHSTIESKSFRNVLLVVHKLSLSLPRLPT